MTSKYDLLIDMDHVGGGPSHDDHDSEGESSDSSQGSHSDRRQAQEIEQLKRKRNDMDESYDAGREKGHFRRQEGGRRFPNQRYNKRGRFDGGRGRYHHNRYQNYPPMGPPPGMPPPQPSILPPSLSSDPYFVLPFPQWIVLQAGNPLPKDETSKIYNEYKNRVMARHVSDFFAQHMYIPWFRELYHPTFVNAREEKSKAMTARRVEVFMGLLQGDRLDTLSLSSDKMDAVTELMEEINAMLEEPQNVEEEEIEEVVPEPLSNIEEAPKKEEEVPQKASPVEKPLEDVELDFTEDVEPKPAPAPLKKKRMGKRRSRMLFVAGLPLHIASPDLAKELARLDGFELLALSTPIDRFHQIRHAWATFSRKTPIEEVRRKASPLYVGNLPLRFSIASDHKLVRVSSVKQGDEDNALLHALVRAFDAQHGLFLQSPNPVLDPHAATDDKLVLYLRVVHSFDYYVAQDYPIENDLANRVCVIHVRRPGKEGLITTDLRDRLRARLEIAIPSGRGVPVPPLPPNMGGAVASLRVTEEMLQAYGKKDEARCVDEFVSNNMKKVREGLVKCTLNSKYFESEEACRKHILSRFGKEIEMALVDNEFFNNYIADPRRPLFPTSKTDSAFSASQMDKDEFGRDMPRPDGSRPIPAPTSSFPFGAVHKFASQPRALLQYDDLRVPAGPPDLTAPIPASL